MNGSSSIPKGPKAMCSRGSSFNGILEFSVQEKKYNIQYISLTPPSNSRWINYIEFEKKKTMLSLSMSHGK
jgi:hypothetical protein